MIFRFEKRSSNNWWHYNGTTQILNFSNWEIVFDEVSQSVNLQQLNGANVPNVNVPIADVRVKNLSGSDETYTTVELLRARLVALGYNPLVVGGGVGSQNLAEVLAIGGREIKYHDTTTGDYTLIPTDKNKIIVLLEDTEIDIIIPASGFSDGDSVIIQNPNGTNSVNLDTTLTTSTITDFSPLLPSYSVAITYYNNGTDIDAYGASYSTNGLAGGGGSQNLQEVTDEGNITTKEVVSSNNGGINGSSLTPFGVMMNQSAGASTTTLKSTHEDGDLEVDFVDGGTNATREWVTANVTDYSVTVVSSNTTASNDTNYNVVANATFTDPTPAEGKGYVVFVRNGTATIGGVGYAVGRIIYRVFHSGAWSSTIYVDKDYVDTGLGTKQDTLTETNFGTFMNARTAKNTLVDADEVVSDDSADSNKAKKTSWLNVWTNYIKVKADAIYATIANLALKTDKTTFIDYSGTSTVVGWSSTTVKEITYKVIDDLVMVTVAIDGTSNATTSSCTLPFNASKLMYVKNSFYRNNGTTATTTGLVTIESGSNVLNFFNGNTINNWTASANKFVYAEIFYFK
jgi:hypothetical protein